MVTHDYSRQFYIPEIIELITSSAVNSNVHFMLTDAEYALLEEKQQRELDYQNNLMIERYEERMIKADIEHGKMETLKMFQDMNIFQFMWWKGERIMRYLLSKKIIQIRGKNE